MTERCMCSFKTQSGFALLCWYRLTYFCSLSSARSSRRKCMIPTNCCAVCWRTPSQAFCLLSLAVHKETWGNAAAGIGKVKQLTERRQAEVWRKRNKKSPSSNNPLGFCQLSNCAFLSTLVTAGVEEKGSGSVATRLLSQESRNTTVYCVGAGIYLCTSPGCAMVKQG